MMTIPNAFTKQPQHMKGIKEMCDNESLDQIRGEAYSVAEPPPSTTTGRSWPVRSMLTASQAAELLQIDSRTLVRWARMGYVPAHPLGEGRRRLWRFLEDELLVWGCAQSNHPRQALGSAA